MGISSLVTALLSPAGATIDRSFLRRCRWSIYILGLLLATVRSATVHAEPRPTEGGFWSFDDADVLETFEPSEGHFRVHYSRLGPNAIDLIDEDNDGVPDTAQRVEAIASTSYSHFVDMLEFRAPLREADFGLELGGSPAIDIYLIDFAQSADGRFALDDCDAQDHCGGFLIVENDFVDYNYPSVEEAFRTVISHELFHAVQAAYSPLPVWVSEGTAVWAERQYDPELADFTRQCGGYLADVGRTIYRPPTGPVAGFSYGTALWWDFLTSRSTPNAIIDLLIAFEQRGDDETDAQVLTTTVASHGNDLTELWIAFARRNLATGQRAGFIDTYPYASLLPEISPQATGTSIDEEPRYYPLAATYWQINHEGGVLWFALEEPVSDVRYSLHPTLDRNDPRVDEALETWTGEQSGARPLLDGIAIPSGTYWLVATLPEAEADVAQTRVCIGTEFDVSTCAPTTKGTSDRGCSVAAHSSPSPVTLVGVWLVLLTLYRRRPPTYTDQAI